MESWIFSADQLVNSPSVRDGISAQDEANLRKKLAEFIHHAGRSLKLPLLTIATATVFMHRFFALESFKKYKEGKDKELFASTCLFLAAKCEESPRRFESVIPEVYRLIYPGRPPVQKDSSDFWTFKDAITKFERTLLITLGFDLQVHHPYKFLLKAAEKLVSDQSSDAAASTADDNNAGGKPSNKNATNDKNLRQVAWNFVNDSMRNGLTLCLRHHPKTIAGACMITACRVLKHRTPENSDHEFWKFVHVPLDTLQAVADEVISMYQKGPKKKKDKSGGSQQSQQGNGNSSSKPAGKEQNGGSDSNAAASGGNADTGGANGASNTGPASDGPAPKQSAMPVIDASKSIVDGGHMAVDDGPAAEVPRMSELRASGNDPTDGLSIGSGGSNPSSSSPTMQLHPAASSSGYKPIRPSQASSTHAQHRHTPY